MALNRDVIEPQYLQRAITTVSCRDTDYIPKISAAGETLHENGVPVQVMHNGVKVALYGYYGAWMSEIIRELRGHHEPQEEALFHEVVKLAEPGSAMIELGAFWSYYSLWFSHEVRDAVNYMVEPGPENLDLGMRNFALNGKSGKFVNAMVSDQETGFHWFPKGASKVFVPMVTVDALCQREKLQRLFMLHSDIQGHELKMLFGARAMLSAQRIDYLFISTHSDKDVHEQCMKFLDVMNYRIVANHTMRQSFSHDGLIVARAPKMPEPRKTAISIRS